ncbi:MAG: N utilization substance protein B, partial [Lysobacter sp.]
MSRHVRKDGIDPIARSRARRRALQAVYAWQMSGADVRNVIAQFAHEQAHEVADLEYFEDLVAGVDAHHETLDEALAPFLDRDIDQVDPVER